MSTTIDYHDRGPITEQEMMPINSDAATMFASDEDKMFFHHFYYRGREEKSAELKNLIDAEIRTLENMIINDAAQETFRQGRITGLQRARNLM